MSGAETRQACEVKVCWAPPPPPAVCPLTPLQVARSQASKCLRSPCANVISSGICGLVVFVDGRSSCNVSWSVGHKRLTQSPETSDSVTSYHFLPSCFNLNGRFHLKRWASIFAKLTFLKPDKTGFSGVHQVGTTEGQVMPFSEHKSPGFMDLLTIFRKIKRFKLVVFILELDFLLQCLDLIRTDSLIQILTNRFASLTAKSPFNESLLSPCLFVKTTAITVYKTTVITIYKITTFTVYNTTAIIVYKTTAITVYISTAITVYNTTAITVYHKIVQISAQTFLSGFLGSPIPGRKRFPSDSPHHIHSRGNTSPLVLQRFYHQQSQHYPPSSHNSQSSEQAGGGEVVKKRFASYIKFHLGSGESRRSLQPATGRPASQSPDPPPRMHRGGSSGLATEGGTPTPGSSPLLLRRSFLDMSPMRRGFVEGSPGLSRRGSGTGGLKLPCFYLGGAGTIFSSPHPPANISQIIGRKQHCGLKGVKRIFCRSNSLLQPSMPSLWIVLAGSKTCGTDTKVDSNPLTVPGTSPPPLPSPRPVDCRRAHQCPVVPSTAEWNTFVRGSTTRQSPRGGYLEVRIFDSRLRCDKSCASVCWAGVTHYVTLLRLILWW
uniref:Uncharacterized protein n=1 Tax=Timema genevievae TaxID=629358 RepID=A0A7R9PI95_TIMGE|nr:unnamed protein product [Timema genevievae]